ncbi:MAG: hypothetical protein ACI9Q3_001017 [Maribacter sp.]|jgi:hypothetical protein
MLTKNELIKKILKDQISINEQNFFLNLSVRLNLNYNTTVYQIKEIHNSITTEKKYLDDYSSELQKIYNYYLTYLKININD